MQLGEKEMNSEKLLTHMIGKIEPLGSKLVIRSLRSSQIQPNSFPKSLFNKVITTMVIRPLNDHT